MGQNSEPPPAMPLAPSQFNPDPPLLPDEPEAPSLFPSEPVLPQYGAEPVRHGLELPRRGVYNLKLSERHYEYPEYPLAARGEGLLPDSEPRPNRWLIDFGRWKRYQDPSIETPYRVETPRLFHPYQQSLLKGDLPIIGQDIFLNLTLKSFSLFEFRKLPTPSMVSSAQANSSEFFGRGEQMLLANDTSIGFEIFKGETAFKPVEWALRVLAVYNNNYIRLKETTLVDPDPRGPGYSNDVSQDNSSLGAYQPDGSHVAPVAPDNQDISKINPGDLVDFIKPEVHRAKKDYAGTRYTTRYKNFFALQEAFLEYHLSDLSRNYDFVTSRVGIQPFVSDFRGFIFSDSNLGVRIFGNYDNNRLQYNLAWFNQREKDTYSDLNTFDSRHQNVFVANLFRQDFLTRGYTAQLSFHANIDDGGTHYDKNDFLVRPAPIGDVVEHDINAYYLGWAGDGHIGRLNISHAFYQVFGRDSYNQLAGREVDIQAQMAALELSYDRDWIRYKLSGFYASGDADPTDGTARGFDTILDRPFFIGGPFSWYAHQGFNLAGTAVNLKQRDSLVPNLRSSNTEGQANFVNPGVFILGAGLDVEVTPTVRTFLNVNYIWLAETKPVEVALHTNHASNDLGLDCSIGFKWRPLLTENILVSAGIGCFFPGNGYKDIYRTNTDPVEGFGPQDDSGDTDRFLYNGFLTLTLIY